MKRKNLNFEDKVIFDFKYFFSFCKALNSSTFFHYYYLSNFKAGSLKFEQTPNIYL
jgi:hypothetical protein